MIRDRQLFWHPATIATPLGDDRWRFFQPLTRRNLVSSRSLTRLAEIGIGGAPESALRAAFEEGCEAVVWADATTFTLWDHVFRNSDLFVEDLGSIVPTATGFGAFRDFALDAGFLSETADPPPPVEKRHFGDRFRGSYHEQIGTECLFNRADPAGWWTGQKFEADLKTLRPTPYKYIEERFLETLFAKELPGCSVLEVGCGTGHFTARMARHADTAAGLDYNADYVETARQSWLPTEGENLCFAVADILELSEEASEVPGAPFDRVVLIDTLLFLFDRTFQDDLVRNRDRFLRSVRRLMKPEGRLMVMDPHPFWLTPWIGGNEHPVGLVAEYRERWFKVTPTLEEMAEALFHAGFRIRRILEPGIDPAYAEKDPRAYAFMRQFPQWWYFEAEPA